jgi:hypothetical protein
MNLSHINVIDIKKYYIYAIHYIYIIDIDTTNIVIIALLI